MNHIQKYRKQTKLTQAELGEAAGLGKQSRIGNYESGIREPGLDECRAIVTALAAAGAINDAGEAVTLDDVFPPAESEDQKPDTAAA